MRQRRTVQSSEALVQLRSNTRVQPPRRGGLRSGYLDCSTENRQTKIQGLLMALCSLVASKFHSRKDCRIVLRFRAMFAAAGEDSRDRLPLPQASAYSPVDDGDRWLDLLRDILLHVRVARLEW